MENEKIKKQKPKHLMIDIETLGTKAGCVMFELSAVGFSLEENKSKMLIDTEPCQINQILSVVDSIEHGFTMESRTLSWWADQGRQLKDIIKIGKNQIDSNYSIILGLSKIIENYNYIWFHKDFDAPILNEYLLYHGCDAIDHYKTMDVRTVMKLYDFDYKDEKYNYGKLHNSIDDCIRQINYLTDCLSEIEHGL